MSIFILPMDQMLTLKLLNHWGCLPQNRCLHELALMLGSLWAAQPQWPSLAFEKQHLQCTVMRFPTPSTWSWPRRHLLVLHQQPNRCYQLQSCFSLAEWCDLVLVILGAHQWLPPVEQRQSYRRRCSRWADNRGNTWNSHVNFNKPTYYNNNYHRKVSYSTPSYGFSISLKFFE